MALTLIRPPLRDLDREQLRRLFRVAAIVLVVDVALLLISLGMRYVQSTDVAALATPQPNPSTLAHGTRAAAAGDALAKFRERILTRETLDRLSTRLQQAALPHNVRVDKASYQRASASDDGLRRWEVAVTAAGSYTELRAFLADLLVAAPSVALQSLSLNRSIDDTRVNADLRLAVFVADQGDDTTTTTAISVSDDGATRDVAALPLDPLAARQLGTARLDLFASTLTPVPPTPPEPEVPVLPIAEFIAPEPPPMPPEPVALPFRYLGRFSEPGRHDVYLLTDNTAVYAVGVGERIGEDYQLSGATPAGLTLTYLPQHSEQLLALGAP